MVRQVRWVIGFDAIDDRFNYLCGVMLVAEFAYGPILALKMPPL